MKNMILLSSDGNDMLVGILGIIGIVMFVIAFVAIIKLPSILRNTEGQTEILKAILHELRKGRVEED